MTRQQAINAKCKECIYDPSDSGTWRQQVARCEINDCALYPYRPLDARSRKAPAQPFCQTIQGKEGVRVGSAPIPVKTPQGAHS